MPNYSLSLTIRFFITFCLVFWIGFSYACFLWTERGAQWRNIIGAVQIAFLQAFKTLALGLLFIVVLFLILDLL